MRERLKKMMPSKAHHEILTAVGSICTQNLLLPIALVITVVGAVVTALVPPLILENIVDGLTAGNPMPIAQAFSYFGVVALAGLLESTRESLLIVFGQKLTHGLRSQMCEKLSQLSADTLSKMDAGTIASRFVGDVDTLETLFTSGIISMFADACTMIGIYVVLWQKKPRTRDYPAGDFAADCAVYKTCSEKNAGCADGQQKGCRADVGSCAGDDSLHPDDPCFWKRRIYAQTL